MVSSPPVEPVAGIGSAEGAEDAGERSDAGDESFENAVPMEPSTDADLPVAREREDAGRDSTPPLESLVQRINPRTRALMAELFKAEVKTVRRLPREKLR